jgi:hypothetical protein
LAEESNAIRQELRPITSAKTLVTLCIADQDYAIDPLKIDLWGQNPDLITLDAAEARRLR